MSNKNGNLAALAALVPCALAACGQAPPPAVVSKAEPAAEYYVASSTFQEVMSSVVDPAADQLWNAVSIRTDATGTHETKPSTAEEWLQLRRAAVLIVESANLISVPGRRVASNARTVDGDDLDIPVIQQRLSSRHDELARFAAAMRDVGGKLVTAADQQDVAALTELGGTLDTVCEACHRAFWYPEQPPIESQ